MLKRKDLLGLIDASASEITEILDLAQEYKNRIRAGEKKIAHLDGKTVTVLLTDESPARVLLHRRPKSGLLAGLWEFPHVPGNLLEEKAAKPVEEWGLRLIDWRRQLRAKHIFTHVEWHMTGYVLSVRGEGEGLTWVDKEKLKELAVPSAFAKFLAAAEEAIESN